MSCKPFSSKIRQEAFRLMNKGASSCELSEKLGLSISNARIWRSEFNNGNFEVEPTRRTHSIEIRQKAYSLFMQGKGYKAVANELALPVYTVRDWHRDFRNNNFHVIPTSRHKRISDSNKETVMRLATSGHTTKEIMEITGLNFYPIRYLRRKSESFKR